MFRCFILFLSLSITFFSYSQNCLPNGFTFLTQAEVNAFPSNYPNCTGIDGFISIGNSNCINGAPSDITNLDSLIQITNIHGYLRISNNPDLINLSGLDDLNMINDNLIITCNDNLIDLSGLNNLVTVGGEIRLGSFSTSDGNEKLENLFGLSSLITPDLSIGSNPSFKNFIGLDAATDLQGLWVSDCDSLENFVGLENISTIHSDGLFVRWNNSNFNFTGLDNLTTIEGFFYLSNNDNQNVNGLLNLSSIEGELQLFSNTSLTDISGFSSLTTVRSLEIVETPLSSLYGIHNISSFYSPMSVFNYIILIGNNNLNDISDLSFLDVTGFDGFLFADNPQLSECAIQSICNAIDIIPPIEVIVENNMTGCNSIAEIETACESLPVTYSEELRAYRQHQEIELEFSVSQQINNSHFEIEHSINGQNFHPIGIIQGEINSNEEINYSFIHDLPKSGNNYYRVKQVDLDGKFSFGRISRVLFEVNSPLIIYPNPAKDYIYSNCIEKNDIIIYSLHGEPLFQGHIDHDGVDITNLKNGVYFYSVEGIKEKLVIMR